MLVNKSAYTEPIDDGQTLAMCLVAGHQKIKTFFFYALHFQDRVSFFSYSNARPLKCMHYAGHLFRVRLRICARRARVCVCVLYLHFYILTAQSVLFIHGAYPGHPSLLLVLLIFYIFFFVWVRTRHTQTHLLIRFRFYQEMLLSVYGNNKIARPKKKKRKKNEPFDSIF